MENESSFTRRLEANYISKIIDIWKPHLVLTYVTRREGKKTPSSSGMMHEKQLLFLYSSGYMMH